jgi:hypothetical protein
MLEARCQDAEELSASDSDGRRDKAEFRNQISGCRTAEAEWENRRFRRLRRWLGIEQAEVRRQSTEGEM